MNKTNKVNKNMGFRNVESFLDCVTAFSFGYVISSYFIDNPLVLPSLCVYAGREETKDIIKCTIGGIAAGTAAIYLGNGFLITHPVASAIVFMAADIACFASGELYNHYDTIETPGNLNATSAFEV